MITFSDSDKSKQIITTIKPDFQFFPDFGHTRKKNKETNRPRHMIASKDKVRLQEIVASMHESSAIT